MNTIGLGLIVIGIIVLVAYGLYNNWKKNIYNQRKEK